MTKCALEALVAAWSDAFFTVLGAAPAFRKSFDLCNKTARL
jgi:hypothetical protein